MPKVGKKKFSYTKKGKQAAKKYAKRTYVHLAVFNAFCSAELNLFL